MGYKFNFRKAICFRLEKLGRFCLRWLPGLHYEISCMTGCLNRLSCKFSIFSTKVRARVRLTEVVPAKGTRSRLGSVFSSDVQIRTRSRRSTSRRRRRRRRSLTVKSIQTHRLIWACNFECHSMSVLKALLANFSLTGFEPMTLRSFF